MPSISSLPQSNRNGVLVAIRFECNRPKVNRFDRQKTRKQMFSHFTLKTVQSFFCILVTDSCKLLRLDANFILINSTTHSLAGEFDKCSARADNLLHITKPKYPLSHPQNPASKLHLNPFKSHLREAFFIRCLRLSVSQAIPASFQVSTDALMTN
jgi:hypothetical protein